MARKYYQCQWIKKNFETIQFDLKTLKKSFLSRPSEVQFSHIKWYIMAKIFNIFYRCQNNNESIWNIFEDILFKINLNVVFIFSPGIVIHTHLHIRHLHKLIFIFLKCLHVERNYTLWIQVMEISSWLENRRHRFGQFHHLIRVCVNDN